MTGPIRYVIAKSSRLPRRESYDGPTCAEAGIAGGRVYADRVEAMADAARLTARNPVGFRVHRRPNGNDGGSAR